MNILPFAFNDEMVNLIAKINEKVARLEESQKLENNLHLRKENRIKTVKSTTAIENNTLSLKQVTDVINGKLVVGNPLEITEVKNTFNAYEHLQEYEPYNIKSFLTAHFYITESRIKSAGKFRIGDVGVLEGKKLVHLGARPQFIYGLIEELFDFAKNSLSHPLIISSVVHYEIETIHPFDDGNGRIGRLWQTAILSKWKKIFEHIPIETVVYKYQSEYYNALEESRETSDSSKFILFMLNAINETLDDVEEMQITDIITDIITDKLSSMEIKVFTTIIKFLLKNEEIDNLKVQELTGKGAESVKKYLSKFVKLALLIPIGQNKGRKYKLNNEILKK